MYSSIPLSFTQQPTLIADFTARLDAGDFAPKPHATKEPSDQLLAQLNTQSFYAIDEQGHRAGNYIQLIALPRSGRTLVLDTKMQQQSRDLVSAAFPQARGCEHETTTRHYYQRVQHH